MLVLNREQTSLVLTELAPLGRVPRWENGALALSETSARRFINDRTRAAQRPRNKLLVQQKAYDPAYLGIGIHEALSTALLQRDYELYMRMHAVITALDQKASSHVLSCEQAAVLLAHNSFGAELFPHIHARSTMNCPTLSVFWNLSGTNTSTLSVFEPLSEDDKAFEAGYTKHKVLAASVRKMQRTDLTISSGQCVLFDAAHVPHSYSYSDDLWLVLVYDQVLGQRFTGTDTFMLGL